MPSQGVFKAQVAHVPDQRDPKAFDKFPPFRGSVTPEEAAEAREREINGAKPEEKGNGNEDDRKVREDKYGDIGDDPGL
jgi:hypothetical protein